MRLIAKFVLVWLGMVCAWAAPAQVEVDPDFEVELIASDGLGGTPVDLDWDPRGRLWVTVVSAEPGIYILQDNDGDGVYEGRQRYYQGQVSGMEFDGGGVIVAGPEGILSIDAGGKAEVLFGGFAGPGGAVEIRLERRGLDGWIYGAVNYVGGGGVPGAVRGRDGNVFGVVEGGIFRFRPDGSAIESVHAVLGRVGGLDFSWDGELFFSAETHLNQVILSAADLSRGRMRHVTGVESLGDHRRAYPRWETGTEQLSGVMLGPGGCVVYEGGAWPEQFHGNYYVAEPALHSVHEDILSVSEGRVEYSAVERTGMDFVKGDSSFWPTGLRVGPDGALYILDTYAPVPAHGRIWRVQHKRARKLEFPDFVGDGQSGLLRTLGHPSRWARATAQRLLVEKKDPAIRNILRMVSGTTRLAPFRIHALWTLHGIGGMDQTSLLKGVEHYQWGVQKNALQILAERSDLITTPVEEAVRGQLKSTSKRVRLQAVKVLGQTSIGDAVIKDLASYFGDERQVWGQSLVAGIARQAPLEFGKKAVESSRSDQFRELMPILVDELVGKRGEEDVARLIIEAAKGSERRDRLKAALLQAVNPHLGKGFTPTWSKDFEKAITSLLEAKSRTVRVAALPLAFHYPSEEDLVEDAADALDEVLDKLKEKDLSESDQEELLSGLLSVWRLESRMIGRLGLLLSSGDSSSVKERVIRDLGGTTSDEAAAVMIAAYSRLKTELRDLVLQALLERRSWTQALVDAVGRGQILASELSLIGLHRLRNHPDGSIARVGEGWFQERVRSVPGSTELLLARLRPLLGELPDVDDGKDGFEDHCASCHGLGEDASGAGPGLGSLEGRSAAELLEHIVDPNRRVEERYRAVNVMTRGGNYYFGVIAQQDRERVVLKDARGPVELRRSDIATFQGTGRSYMPEGLPSLGGEALRDIIGYLRDDPPRGFKLVDLTSLATVDSRLGLYHPAMPLIDFIEFGIVDVSGEPYRLLDPESVAGGRNLLMLQGGQGFSKALPRRVEIPLDVVADEIFFLSGVAAWGYPYGDIALHHVPAMKVVIHYEDGGREEIVLRNGEEFADIAGPNEVPGSKRVSGVVRQGQLRRFSMKPEREERIRSLVVESYDNHLAPVIVAVTIELEE